MNPQFEERDPNAPVGYGADGKPLYAAPQQDKSYAKNGIGMNTSHVTTAPQEVDGHDFNPQIRKELANEPNVVHTSRNPNAEPFELSDEVRSRHEKSKRDYPHLNLSHGEFVVLDIKRHPIGLLGPLLGGGVLIIALVTALTLYPANPSTYGLPSFALATLVIGLLMILVGIGVLIAVWVYLQNQFYLTNESVIQEIQTSLFSRQEQMVSLGSIEDASFGQTGILQTMLNYGSMRLSTEGDETTYRFTYVANPRTQVNIVNDAIEAFKNGRPFDPKDDVN